MSYVDAINRIDSIKKQLEFNTQSKETISPNSETMFIITILDKLVLGLEESAAEGKLAETVGKIKYDLDKLEKQLLEYSGLMGGAAISQEKLKETGEGSMMNWLNEAREEINDVITDHKEIKISMFNNPSPQNHGNKPSQGSGA